MSLSHLLSLSALHTEAPGVLNVIFGPDGNVKGAPRWAGPMTSLADPSRHGWVVWRGVLHVSLATSDGHWSSTVEQWRERWALDLRVPSVAARLAGLCAQALAQQRAGIDREHELNRQTCIAAQLGLTLDPELPARLAALTLARALQIAALRSSPPTKIFSAVY